MSCAFVRLILLVCNMLRYLFKLFNEQFLWIGPISLSNLVSLAIGLPPLGFHSWKRVSASHSGFRESLHSIS